MIGYGLQVLFVGVNPGIRSGETHHHFAHASSRLWMALYESGFTPHVVQPAGERALLRSGIGLTNLVDRPTRAADELTVDELRNGAATLRHKVCRYRPEWVAILGVVAYRIAFAEPDATVGRQTLKLCSSRVWVLPGPTGRNAHFPLPRLIREFNRLHRHVRSIELGDTAAIGTEEPVTDGPGSTRST